MNIKKGDAVMIIAGKDKGKSGVVSKTLTVDGKDKVVVEGLNIVKKTKKARKANDRAEIIKKAAPLDVSNVMPVCGECGAITRVKKTAEQNEKGKTQNVRTCRKCNASLDSVKTSKAKSTVKKAKKAAKKADKAEE